MPSRARSLAEDLRHRSDEALAELFLLRPQLRHPVPRSFADLALRANSAAATVVSLDDLTRAELSVLEAACALSIGGRFTAADLADGLGEEGGSPRILQPLQSLMVRALLWGALDDVRVPSAVRDAMGREPCGLDSIARPHLPVSGSDELRRSLEEGPAQARAMLMAVLWGPPVLRAANNSDALAARDWLVANSYVIRDEVGSYLVPREVALALRRGQLMLDAELVPPDASLPANKPPDSAQRLNGHAADQFVRSFDRVLRHLSREDVRQQANGAIQTRDWDRMLTATGLPAAEAALIIDLAWTTESIDLDEDRQLRPTTQFEHRARSERSIRWATLADAWLRSPRTVAITPERVLAITGTDDTPAQRALVLTAADRVVRPAVRAWLAWHRPRRIPTADFIAGVLTESDALGLTHSPDSSHTDHARLARYIDPLLPELTERIVLQADLTATAMGPLARDVEERLTQVADAESGGAASVFRFTAESIARGLADGLGPGVIRDWLADVSATPVPQALTVLVQDVAAALPRITVNAAAAVIRCDPEIADQLLGDPKLADLGLHLLAPGILLSSTAPTDLNRRLRELGHLVDSPDIRRKAVRSDRPPARKAFPEPPPERIVQSLRQVEFREHPEEHPPDKLASTGPAELQQRLFTASVNHQRIWLAFSDDDGSAETHLIEPLSIAEGEVCAFDVTVGEIRMIPLARVVGLAPSER